MTITQDVLDALAKSVADTIFARSGKVTGYHAKIEPKKNRVLFTFKAAELYAYSAVPLDDLHKANSWQGLCEGMAEHSLKHLDPTVKWAPDSGPEIPVFVDQRGNRHHTMKAETGYLGLRGK